MHRSLRYLKQMRHGKIITPQSQYAENYVRPYFTLTDDKSFITFLFFQVLNFFLHRFFLHLWLQSMLERQVLRLLVDPCYTADDRPNDNHQGNRACYSDYDVNHYVVYVVVVVI